MRRQVFYSFHYANDAMRVQQIRNMGAFEGNPPASANAWEQVKRSGDRAIKNWIDDAMQNKSCVIVLVGSETASRKWVRYEIEKAWTDGRGLMGIYIHNLRDPHYGTCQKGENPFGKFKLGDENLANIVPCHDPLSRDAYWDIKNHLSDWIEQAIELRKHYN